MERNGQEDAGRTDEGGPDAEQVWSHRLAEAGGSRTPHGHTPSSQGRR